VWRSFIELPGTQYHVCRYLEKRTKKESVNPFAGGGMGRLSFYDLCAERYINVGKVEESVYLPLGEGWLDKGAMYQTHFHNTVSIMLSRQERENRK